MLSLLLCLISFGTLARRTTSDPALDAVIKGAPPDWEAPGADISGRLQGTSAAEEPENQETLRSEIENSNGSLGRWLVDCLDGFKGACLEVYFQPDTLRIGGRARFSPHP